MRATVIATSPPVSDTAGAIVRFRTDEGTEASALACNFTRLDRIAIDSALNT